MKPVIMVNGGASYDRVFCESSWVINKAYPTAVAAAGGVPLMPVDMEMAEDYAKMADGLILTGSIAYTPDPSLKGRLKKEEEPKRTVFDRALYEAFKKEKKPVFGICLGLQEINLFQGGTLACGFKYQDGVEHMKTAHAVRVEKGTVLYSLFGENFQINSRHNNRIEILGRNLKATAWSPDGVIEAIEHEKLPITAVEWHPERMRGDIPEPPDGPDMTKLFQWFVNCCK